MSASSEPGVTDGTEQEQRFPLALRPGYFDVDELSLEDLLAMSGDFAGHLRFYDLQNEARGTWEAFLTADDAAVMAWLLSRNETKIEQEFLQCLDFDSEQASVYLSSFGQDLDSWLDRLQSNRADRARRLSDEIAHIFGSEIFAAARSSTKGAKEARLRSRFYELLSGLRRAKEVTRPYLEESLRSQGHDPAAALFIGFLRLYQRAQQRVNAFTQRHLDFYYRRVLGVHPREAVPDQAFLLFEPDSSTREIRIAKGTRFTAGKDSEFRDILFTADNDLVVTDARVESLRTLHLQRDQYISPQRELAHITRIKAGQRVAMPDGQSGRAQQPWSPFDMERLDASHGAATDAVMGFAIASPVLLLREGARTIDVYLRLGFPEDVVEALELAVGHLQPDPGIGTPNASHQCLIKVFEAFLDHDADLRGGESNGAPGLSAGELAETLAASVSDEQRDAVIQGLQSGHPEVAYKVLLLSLLPRTVSREHFFRVVGRLLSHDLLMGREWLSLSDRAEVLAETKQRGVQHRVDQGSERAIEELFGLDFRYQFERLLPSPFSISLTAESGWSEVADYFVVPRRSPESRIDLGLQFRLRLGYDAEPVVSYSREVHGSQLHTSLPVLRFQVNQRASFIPFSLLGGLDLREVEIEASVEGLTDIVGYNDIGQVDTSRPFQPFGPLPAIRSSLVFGSYELARKSLAMLTVNVEWSRLPTLAGGFREHYQDYGLPIDNGSFLAEISVLRDGHWRPGSGAKAPEVALFASDGPGGPLVPRVSLDFDILSEFKPIPPDMKAESFASMRDVRDGYFRLRLARPGEAFGHAQYPNLLTSALMKAARKKRLLAVPREPYTPVMERISVSYRARARIDLGADPGEEIGVLDEQVFHLHPFGVETVHPASKDGARTLLPSYREGGNLFIGLSAAQPGGLISLLFEVFEDSSQDTAGAEQEISWFYLGPQGWQPLPPNRLLSDSTEGFLASGIVTLDIPGDIDNTNTIMPTGLFWLRVSARQNLEAFPSLLSVRAQALTVTRAEALVEGREQLSRLPSESIKEAMVSIPGLRSITQVGESFGGRPRENHDQLVTRISERLRHKSRASSSWDYEHLILERFPEIFKVKCFPNVVVGRPGLHAGRLLVVVVPYLRRTESERCRRRMVNAADLERIRDFVQGLSSPFALIDVRNPVYERVQVRCSVKWADDSRDGHYARRLNQDLSDMICPWRSGGYRAKFGWSVCGEDVEAFVRDLDYVEFVTNFSMLHITMDEEGSYLLEDTVRATPRANENIAEATLSHSARVEPRYPWSLAIPVRDHFIETVDTFDDIRPELTGIGELEIGYTFIVSGQETHGKAQ